MNVLYSLTPAFCFVFIFVWECWDFMRRHFPDWQFPTFFPQNSTRLVQRFPQIFVDRCDPRVDSTCGGTIYFCWFFDRTSMPIGTIATIDFRWFSLIQRWCDPRAEAQDTVGRKGKTKCENSEMGKLNTKRVKWKQNAKRVKWEHGQGVVMVWVAVYLCHN